MPGCGDTAINKIWSPLTDAGETHTHGPKYDVLRARIGIGPKFYRSQEEELTRSTWGIRRIVAEGGASVLDFEG